jgi:hypothetical protein
MVHFQDDPWPAIEGEFGLLTADEVSARSGDADAVAGLMSVQCGGAPLYPSFQLDPVGQPLPVFEALRQLADHLDVPRNRALLWVTIPNAWWSHEGSRPVDHLDDPASILRAFDGEYGVDW